jgi:hypothetical protein
MVFAMRMKAKERGLSSVGRSAGGAGRGFSWEGVEGKLANAGLPACACLCRVQLMALIWIMSCYLKSASEQ